MRLFDLHCDTLYRAFKEKKSIISNDFEISLDKGKDIERWVQSMAVWIPDEIRGAQAECLVDGCYKLLKRELAKCGDSVGLINSVGDVTHKINIMLTLEGGAALGGKLENIEKYKKMGFRAMTLTWNGSCEIGDGADIEDSQGLTDFGRRAVEEMERCGIVVDVSHASDRLFYDVAQTAQRPFIATHSNSRSVYAHRRNITDEQFEIIKNSGGIVGLTYHRHFLNKDNQSVTDIVRHTERFLSLGGENSVALGSDFDGGELPDDLHSVADMHKIYSEFARLNYSETLIDKLFFRNAFNFYQSFDN